MNRIYQTLSDYITAAKRIAVVGHYNPDGDATGASMGMYYYLTSLGKEVRVLMPNPSAENLHWMDPDKKNWNYQSNEKAVEDYLKSTDLLFCMDFQSLDRTDKMATALQACQAKKVLIDHHLSPKKEEFDLCFSNQKVSSTCELAYTILKELSPEGFTKEMANCFYAGICTDTGSFSYACAHADLYRNIAELIDLGVDTVEIHRKIFDTFSEDRLRLLGFCLSERLVVNEDCHTAYMYLSKNELDKFNYQPGDTEGVVNYALTMKNIYFAAFFTERENRIRISFRSQGNVDVNVFAKEYFNGGGHRNAAGGNSYENLEKTIAKFESLLPAFSKSFKTKI